MTPTELVELIASSVEGYDDGLGVFIDVATIGDRLRIRVTDAATDEVKAFTATFEEVVQ